MPAKEAGHAGGKSHVILSLVELVVSKKLHTSSKMASNISHGPSRERLAALEKIEGNIASAIQSAGQALQELSKDKPILKHAEGHTTTFIKTLQEVENGLMQQITYLMQVSTGQPHEGSCYAAAKDLQMAMHRSEHVKSRLGELEKLKQEHLRMKHSGLVRGYSLPEQAR